MIYTINVSVDYETRLLKDIGITMAISFGIVSLSYPLILGNRLKLVDYKKRVYSKKHGPLEYQYRVTPYFGDPSNFFIFPAIKAWLASKSVKCSVETTMAISFGVPFNFGKLESIWQVFYIPMNGGAYFSALAHSQDGGYQS